MFFEHLYAAAWRCWVTSCSISLAIARKLALTPWTEISANIYNAGTSGAAHHRRWSRFWIGIVLSYLSAQQLRLFGANQYIVNILGLSVIRELGPVLSAILVVGRSRLGNHRDRSA